MLNLFQDNIRHLIILKIVGFNLVCGNLCLADCKNDSSKAAVILLEIEKIQSETANYEKSCELIDEVFDIVRKCNLENTIINADALNNYAVYWIYKYGDFNTGIYYLKKSLQVAEDVYGPNNPELAPFYTNIGYVYEHQNNLDSAINCHLKAIKFLLLDSIKYQPELASIYMNLGGAYHRMEKLDSGLYYHFKSLNIRDNLIDSKPLFSGESFHNISIILIDMERWDEALIYSKKAEAAYFVEKDTPYRHLSAVYNSIGFVYKNTNNLDSALYYYEKCLSIGKFIYDENHVELALTLSNVGGIYLDKGEFNKALHYFEKALQLEKNEYGENHLNVASNLGLIGLVNLKLSQHKEALTHFKQSLKIKINILGLFSRDAMDDYKNIARVYAGINDFRNSYLYLDSFSIIRDSILNEKKVSAIEEMKEKYESENKTQQIEILNKDKLLSEAKNQRQKTQMLFGVAIAIIVLASTIAIFYFMQKQEKALYEKQVSEAELGALRARMDPHFIDNSLFSILGFLKKNDNEKASNYLLKFSELIGAILLKSGKSEILLSEELDIVRNYLDTQKINEYAFDYEINVDESIDTEDILFPSLMLQPFAENAVKHGFDKIDYKGKLTINILKVNELLVCEIIDNGKGRKEELKMDNKKKSVSIALNKQRIEIYNRGRNKNASFNITDLAQGVKVELKVPIQYNFA